MSQRSRHCSFILLSLAWLAALQQQAFATSAGTSPAPALQREGELFVDSGTQLTGLSCTQGCWADFDQDGDPDLLLTGVDSSWHARTLYYRNDAGLLTEASCGLPGDDNSLLLSPADIDGDGDLDLLVSHVLSADIHLNQDGMFTPCGLDLPVAGGEGCWADADADGDLDLLLVGNFYGNGVPMDGTELLLNDKGALAPTASGLPEVSYGHAAWGDADGDGDLDLLLTGLRDGSQYITRLFLREATGFVDSNANLPDIGSRFALWGDMDADGRTDLLLSGQPASGSAFTTLFRNTESGFVPVQQLEYLESVRAQLGDVDNDGDPDLVLMGITAEGAGVTRVYLNSEGLLTDSGLILPGYQAGACLLGDVDGDGDLDLLLSGEQDDMLYHTVLYLNTCSAVNTPPAAPGPLTLATSPGCLQLSWGPASDTTTPAAALWYNLRLGRPGMPDLRMPGMADHETGHRLVAAMGNAGQVTSHLLQYGFLGSELYPQEERRFVAAVQAIDASLAGGPWSEASLDLSPEIRWLELRNPLLMRPSDLLSWELSHLEQLDHYELQLAADPGFTTILGTTRLSLDSLGRQRELFAGLPLSTASGFEQVQQGLLHYWRVRPVYEDAQRITLFSEQPGSFTLVAAPQPPQAFTIQLLQGQVQLSWEAVPGSFVYYIVHSSSDAGAPFPQGWQPQSPTLETQWLDPQPSAERRFYRVQAVVLDRQTEF